MCAAVEEVSGADLHLEGTQTWRVEHLHWTNRKWQDHSDERAVSGPLQPRGKMGAWPHSWGRGHIAGGVAT